MVIETTKAVAYAVLRPPTDEVSVAKAVAYAMLRPPAARVSVSKAVAYAVLRPAAPSAAPRIIQPIIIGY